MALTAVLMLAAVATAAGGVAVFSLGDTEQAVWTTKGDFENNASTVVYPTDGNMVAVSGSAQSDNAGVSLASIKSMPIAAGWVHTIGLKSDGTVVSVGSNLFGQRNVSSWSNIVSIATATKQTVGLKSDGTVVCAGSCSGESSWTGIVDFDTGYSHTVGLKSDGTVVAAGSNSSGQLDTASWSGMKDVAAGMFHTVALKNDGTVVGVGSNGAGQLNTSSWAGIVAVAAMENHTLGLKSNGTVVAVGDNSYGQLNVSSWTGITAISAGNYHTLGLKSNGTVVAVGKNSDSQVSGVSSWSGIVAISAGGYHSTGVKSNGSAIAVGYSNWGQSNLSAWSSGMKQPDTAYSSSGVLSNLRLDASGEADWGQISWNGSVPAGASLKFRTRGADSEENLSSASWSQYYTASGSAITTTDAQWLEVEARLDTANASLTPVLDDVSVSYNVAPPCEVDAPILGLSTHSAYWASYDEYTAGVLSVNYSIANTAASAALNTTIAGSANTNGVTIASSLPIAVGDIASYGSAPLTVKYNIPAGVASFKSSLYATAQDACGATHSYPGPVPAT